MEWIFTHGAQAVVNTSQLHTRGETPPVASHIVSRAFAVPIPPDTSQSIPEFIPSVTFEFENLTEDMADTFMNEDSESDEDSENYDFDFDDEDAGFAANPVFNIASGACIFIIFITCIQDTEMPGIDGNFFNNTFFPHINEVRHAHLNIG
jgi:hypothetical protein